jgi:hypothetical protein
MAPRRWIIFDTAAVFGGAARVPIATLLMVTEMTGGVPIARTSRSGRHAQPSRPEAPFLSLKIYKPL